jgi:hypothetical protein
MKPTARLLQSATVRLPADWLNRRVHITIPHAMAVASLQAGVVDSIS